MNTTTHLRLLQPASRTCLIVLSVQFRRWPQSARTAAVRSLVTESKPTELSIVALIARTKAGSTKQWTVRAKNNVKKILGRIDSPISGFRNVKQESAIPKRVGPRYGLCVFSAYLPGDSDFELHFHWQNQGRGGKFSQRYLILTLIIARRSSILRLSRRLEWKSKRSKSRRRKQFISPGMKLSGQKRNEKQ